MPGAVTGVVAAATEVVALAEAVCDADANPKTAPPVTVVIIRASVPAARHPLRARLADCLLAYREKTSLTRLPLTQERLSVILGANRTTVTALAINLSEAGLTRTGRGWISVVDAERLDHLACGCRKAGASGDIKAATPALA